MKTLIFILSLSISPSNCKNPAPNSIAKHSKAIKKYQYEYATTQNKKYVDSSYHWISRNYTVNVVVNQEILELIFPVYFNLEKYEELSNILKNKNELDSFTENYTINFLKIYGSLKIQNQDAVKYAANSNMELIKDKFRTTPSDSLLLMDLCRVKTHIEDMEVIFLEVDSLSVIVGLPSAFFTTK